jgi:hypothetical protein
MSEIGLERFGWQRQSPEGAIVAESRFLRRLRSKRNSMEHVGLRKISARVIERTDGQ